MHRVVVSFVLALVFSLAWTAESRAQVRRAYVGARPVVVVRGYFADPFWPYDPFWAPYPYWGYPYPPYRYYGDPGASMRLEVKPKEAEVYVDGYYAGIVDDFDGVFQRLRVPPGEHEITLYLDGFRTVHQRIYLTPDNTFKLKYSMERLGAGETPEPRPQPANEPAMAPPPGAPQQPPGYPPYPPARGPVTRRAPQPPNVPPPPPMPGTPEGRGGAPSDFGTLAVRVQPGDADILVDGEKWGAPAGQERVMIDVPEGRHTIQVQKPGYRTYITDVEVRRGATTPVNVSLRSQEEQ